MLEQFTWSTVFVLIAGIMIGFIMCAFIYLLMILASFKKNQEYKSESDVCITDDDIQVIIRSAQNQFIEESANLTIPEKLIDVRNISWQLIHDIAKVYYPDSEYPIYELTIDEMIILNHYITDRIDSLFKGRIIGMFKRIRIAQIINILELKRKLDESKVMKAANKAHISGVFKTASAVLNVFNPGYWVKKIMINTTMSIGSNKLATTIIDIVAEETVKVYSKSVFNKEKSIDTGVAKTIKEIEESIESGKM